MSQDSTLADLAAMRSLAEEGRRAPLLSGPHLVGWGLLVAAAFAGHGVIVNTVPPSGDWGVLLGALWGGFGLLGGLMSALLGRRAAQHPGASAISNQVDRAVWAGASLIMAVFAIGMIGHMAFSGDFTAPNAIPAAAFAVYGGAMLASSLIAGDRLLRLFGPASAGVGLVLAVAADMNWMYFAAAAGALFVLALPGVLMLGRAKRTLG